MPITTLRASGNNQYGQLTDAERAAEAERRRMDDWVMRRQLQDSAAQVQREGIQSGERIAGMGESGADRRQAAALKAQMDMGGTFDQRTAAQTSLLDRQLGGQKELAEIGQRPAMAEQARRNQEYADQAAMRELANAKARGALTLMEQVLPSGGGQQPQGPVNPGDVLMGRSGPQSGAPLAPSRGGLNLSDEDRRHMAFGMMGMNAPSNTRDLEDRETRRGIALEMLKNRDPKVRIRGAQILAESGGAGGLGAGDIATAFAPRVDANEVLADPVIARELEDIAMAAAESGPQAVIELRPRLDALKLKAVQAGADAAEVDIAVQDYLDQKLPSGGTNPISWAIQGMMGQPLVDGSVNSTRRKNIGIRY